MLLYVHRDYKDYYGCIRDGEPRTATTTFTHSFLSSETLFKFSVVQVQCCFTSTETIRTTRDGEPRIIHLDFHTAPELCPDVDTGSRL